MLQNAGINTLAIGRIPKMKKVDCVLTAWLLSPKLACPLRLLNVCFLWHIYDMRGTIAIKMNLA
jgi:hypothetical protein